DGVSGAGCRLHGEAGVHRGRFLGRNRKRVLRHDPRAQLGDVPQNREAQGLSVERLVTPGCPRAPRRRLEPDCGLRRPVRPPRLVRSRRSGSYSLSLRFCMDLQPDFRARGCTTQMKWTVLAKSICRIAFWLTFVSITFLGPQTLF